LKEQIPPAAPRAGRARVCTAVIGLQSASRFGFYEQSLSFVGLCELAPCVARRAGRASLHNREIGWRL